MPQFSSVDLNNSARRAGARGLIAEMTGGQAIVKTIDRELLGLRDVAHYGIHSPCEPLARRASHRQAARRPSHNSLKINAFLLLYSNCTAEFPGG